VKRLLVWSALVAAVGIAHYFATVWYCTEGAFAGLLETGPRWLVRLINYVFFFPIPILGRLGLSSGVGIPAFFAANSAMWTVTVGATALGGRRLLTWWPAARRRKMHTPDP
jgi:hypothetical protein